MDVIYFGAVLFTALKTNTALLNKNCFSKGRRPKVLNLFSVEIVVDGNITLAQRLYSDVIFFFRASLQPSHITDA